MDPDKATLIVLGFAAGAALTLIAVVWIAVAIKRRADADVQSILLERQVEELPAAEGLRLAWDRQRPAVEAEEAAPLEVLTAHEEANLSALAEGIRAGSAEARRRLAVEEAKRTVPGGWMDRPFRNPDYMRSHPGVQPGETHHLADD